MIYILKSQYPIFSVIISLYSSFKILLYTTKYWLLWNDSKPIRKYTNTEY